MKNILISLAISLSLNLIAQSPEKMSYQAIVRNSDNQLVLNEIVGLKISILQGSPSGTAVYSETHLPITNGNGLFSIEVGNGTVVTGTFNLIDWKTGQYWLQTEVDPLGGTNYSITAVSQLLSVPYAFYSNYSEMSGNGIQTVNDNGDGTLTFQFENGTSYTSPVLTGLQGQAGADGQDGISVQNTFVQNDSLFVSLSNGQTINTGYVKGLQGTDGIQGVSGTNGLNGNNGVDGVSVLNSYIQNDSLYVFLSNGQTINTGFARGSQGPAGIQGLTGANGNNGAPGTNGVDGISVLNTYIQNDSLKLVLSNGQTINAGLLAGVSITNTVIQNDSLIVSLSNGQTINAGYLNCPGQNINLPSVITIDATDVRHNGATVNFKVTSDGNEMLLTNGVCLSTSPNPTYLDLSLREAFPSQINTVQAYQFYENVSLPPNTQYYARAFASNAKGTTYGNEITFTTTTTTADTCVAVGSNNCTINLAFDDVFGPTYYSNTLTGILTVNSDLTASLTVSDPNMPYECTTFTLSGSLDCQTRKLDLSLYIIGSCSAEFHGFFDQNFTHFSSDTGIMFSPNREYSSTLEITLQ